MQGKKGTWKRATRDALISGSAASVASTTALLAAGAIENRRPFSPVNAISHWYWGKRATRRDALSLRYTLTGYVTHHVASIFWATMHERAFGRRRRSKLGAPELAAAATTAAVACFVDYQLTPQRLTPGYEHRLSRKSLLLVYAMFAIGLAVGGRIVANHDRRPRARRA